MPESLPTTIRDLHRRRGRERRARTLAEGVRLVEEAATAGLVDAAVVSPALEAGARGGNLIAGLEGAGIPVMRVPDAELEKLAQTEHPQGIIAVIRTPPWKLADLDSTLGRALLVLDGVQDPGNAGAILRTALGLGASGVIALPGTAELTNPKVVRGSMGALFRLPAFTLTVAEFLEWVGKRSASLLLADTGGTPVADMKASAPVALVLGNEGAGVNPELLHAGRAVAIPLAPGAESLNVAVAAGILLYEVMRVR